MRLEGDSWRCQRDGAKISKKLNKKRRKVCRKKMSIYSGSFFANNKLPANEVLFIAYFWLLGLTHKQIMQATGHGEHAITDYLALFRDVIQDDVRSEDQRIGGTEIEVEIDESKFGKRKYNKGHHVEGVWIFGGVERTEERRMFAVIVQDRTEKTLLDIRRKYVKPGSIIISDCWAAYNNIEEKLNMEHLTVNHSQTYKDPDTGAHTNTIEGTWNGLKLKIPVRNRTNKLIDRHLHEYVWRRQNADDLWMAFINCLAKFTFNENDTA
jgi:hypothetical protein